MNRGAKNVVIIVYFEVVALRNAKTFIFLSLLKKFLYKNEKGLGVRFPYEAKRDHLVEYTESTRSADR